VGNQTAGVAPALLPDGRARPVELAGRRIRILRDSAELAGVRDAWQRLQTNEIAVDPDFYEAALEADPLIVRPHVVVLERDGEPEAMVVARIESLSLAVKLGYKKVFTRHVRSLTVVYGGLFGIADEETFGMMLASLRRSLADNEADVCIFRHLPVDSPWYRIASSEPSFLVRQHVAEVGVHWELDLPGSVDELKRTLSKRTRQNLNNYANRLKRDFGDSLEVRVFEDPAEIDELFRDVETVAAKTYQRGLGVAFGDTPAHRRRTQLCMERGWFRGYVLYLEGRPVAFGVGERYHGTYRAGRPGYDPDFAGYRPGTYLLLWSIDDLCRDPEVSVLDLGLGDAEFKRRFCNRGWEEASVAIYAPRLRPIALNLTRSALLKGTGQVKQLASRSGVLTKVKRRWRDRLRSQLAT
jgi:hypothetical protein